VGLAGGAAVAAAMIGTAGAPIVLADTGVADVILPTSALGQAELAGEQMTLTESLSSDDVPTQYQAVLEGQLAVEQTALDALSGTEAVQGTNDLTGFDALLVNSVDQQFASDANGLYGGVVGLVGNPSPTTEFDLLLDDYRLDGAASDLWINLPRISDLGTVATSAATDLATSASNASTTPDDVIGQAISDLNHGTAVLTTAVHR
jgi:hypothetical protein